MTVKSIVRSSQPGSTPLLTIRHLNVFYSSIHALQDINLEICTGEIVALIGANGAGKTTTLKAISGLIRGRSGEIVYRGQDITNRLPHDIARLGIAHVPEGRKPFANLTVRENLIMGAFRFNDRKVIQPALDRIFKSFPRLQERLDQPAGTLSGGELQMLAMGRGLMLKPDLLMLDEPSMGLSPMLVNEIFSIIREINITGTSILLVEQNAHKALSIAHYAYVLETGRVVIEGRGQDLHQDPMVREAYLGT